MARPVKLTVDFFPHYCQHKKTVFILEQTFGNDGYAFWFKLLEQLGSTPGHVIDLSNNGTGEFLYAYTKCSAETATKILNLLAKLGAIDKELWDEHVIWSQNLVDNLSEVYTRRKVSKPEKPSHLLK